MSEKNLNFDQPVERRGTHSLKYDFAEERGRKKDILPLWVADMDFKTSSFVQEALIRQAEHGIYGYTESDQEYYDAVSSWMERRHGWKIDKEWITKTPGIVFALAMAVKAYTEPGDYILIQDMRLISKILNARSWKRVLNYFYFAAHTIQLAVYGQGKKWSVWETFA